MATEVSPAQSRATMFWAGLLCALSMALTWRIRGQFGHEIGAAMAGALGAMAIVLFSGREDWQQRIHHFALLGALGWAFGGSMSYMKNVGFIHSSQSATVLYGFAAVFFTGFLWSALGGAGTALPAVLDREKLAGLFPPLAAVLIAWLVQDVIVDWKELLPSSTGELGGTLTVSGFARYDVDWLAATVAVAAVLVLALVRRRFDFGTSLVLHLAVGWWVAFLGLVVLLGLRLNPPRGDNWAGCVGIFAGLLVFCRRRELGELARASIVTGFLGGAGFCLGGIVRLTGAASDREYGWHGVMEWSHGLFFGIGLAFAMSRLMRNGPRISGPPLRRWMELLPVVFVLCVIPYLNFRKSPGLWLKHVKSLTAEVYGLPLMGELVPSSGWVGWYDLAWLLFTALVLALLLRHTRRPIPLLPTSWVGKGQLLYVVFLWMITLMSCVHEIPLLNPVNVSMLWLEIANASLCTWLVLSRLPDASATPAEIVGVTRSVWIGRTLAWGSLLAVLAILAGWSFKRAVFGGRFAPGFYMDHIRFGPNNTNDRK